MKTKFDLEGHVMAYKVLFGKGKMKLKIIRLASN